LSDPTDHRPLRATRGRDPKKHSRSIHLLPEPRIIAATGALFSADDIDDDGCKEVPKGISI
jgi:hypothetical protein